jgi:hypothetical protein
MVKIDKRDVGVTYKEIYRNFKLLENQDIANDTVNTRIMDDIRGNQGDISNSVMDNDAAFNRIPKYRLKFIHSDSNVRKHPIVK